MSDTRLEGKVALVTGASHERGIGRGIALALARAGADVACSDIGFDDHGRALVDEINGLGRRATFSLADVSQRAAVDQLIAGAQNDLGALDIV
ncbi:MAG: SDR family NAD(P)-dependent oxidoreductase, partial [Gaiellaceae bacterium]